MTWPRPTANAHLLKYDSTFGPLHEEVKVSEDTIAVGPHSFKVYSEKDPKALPWGELGVDVVIESTGRFTDGEKAVAHIEAGAKRVIISAPATNVDGTFVVGVNDDTFDPAVHRVVSNASCTTNCFVPMIKVLDDAFGVEKGLMTTVHAYTNDQNLLDLVHKDMRRSRAAAVNIVPSSTGAAKATSLVLYQHEGPPRRLVAAGTGPGRLHHGLHRDPRPRGDCRGDQRRLQSCRHVRALAPVLVYTEDPIVSSDIVGSPASCTFDSKLTMVLGSMVKVFGWYDNEWGYSNRLIDLALIAGRA